MTNKELLELAAKAAGIKFSDYGYDVNDGLWIEFTLAERKLTTICAPTGWHWNPLEDDGDAFRLAVKLSLFDGLEKRASYIASTVNFDIEPSDATRRAIVIAAAEIGRAMQ